MRAALPLLLAVLAGPAQAGGFSDTADVLAVSELRETYTVPREQCWTETEIREERSLGGPIVGGLAGGILGNQVGKGSGRTVATVAGALTGAIVGDRLSEHRVSREPVRKCRTEYESASRVRAYSVTYRYAGRVFTEEMPYDPGREVRVDVTLSARP
jgi:uncharacterized protein YcfJ